MIWSNEKKVGVNSKTLMPRPSQLPRNKFRDLAKKYLKATTEKVVYVFACTAGESLSYLLRLKYVDYENSPCSVSLRSGV